MGVEPQLTDVFSQGIIHPDWKDRMLSISLLHVTVCTIYRTFRLLRKNPEFVMYLFRCRQTVVRTHQPVSCLQQAVHKRLRQQPVHDRIVWNKNPVVFFHHNKGQFHRGHPVHHRPRQRTLHIIRLIFRSQTVARRVPISHQPVSRLVSRDPLQ